VFYLLQLFSTSINTGTLDESPPVYNFKAVE